MKETKVYVSIIGDLIHSGHLDVIKEATKYGKVTVGVLTKDACAELNDIPHLGFSDRKRVIENLRDVSEVVPQNTASYLSNLEKYEIDIVVHSDNWKTTSQSKYRDEVIGHLGSDHLIEIPYNSTIGNLAIKESIYENGVTPTQRQRKLSYLIDKNRKSSGVVKILECHNALSGLIAENEEYENKSFDGMWSSSLTDSTVRGKPDIESVSVEARLNTINEIFEVTTKPMIYDADTGRLPEHFALTVKSLERTGISAVIIEDKIGLKKNSLFGNDVSQQQDTIVDFQHKIRAGKNAQITDHFMIIARVESLILDAGLEDALERAHAYVDAGADGVMIHSRLKDPSEILEFVRRFRDKDQQTPLVVVPTSFNSVTTKEFSDMGVDVVIYANHMLRASYLAMSDVASGILKHGRTLEVEPKCMKVKEILELIPGTK